MLLTVVTLRLQNCKSWSPSRDDSSVVSLPDIDLDVRWWEKSLGEVGEAGTMGGFSRRHISQRQPRLALPLGCLRRLSKIRIQSWCWHMTKRFTWGTYWNSWIMATSGVEQRNLYKEKRMLPHVIFFTFWITLIKSYGQILKLQFKIKAVHKWRRTIFTNYDPSNSPLRFLLSQIPR